MLGNTACSRTRPARIRNQTCTLSLLKVGLTEHCKDLSSGPEPNVRQSPCRKPSDGKSKWDVVEHTGRPLF